jgi:hypothetical protein
MPPVVAGAAALGTAVTAYVAANAGTILITALLTGAQFALNAYEASKANGNKPQNQRQSLEDNFAQDVPVRYYAFGKTSIGGVYAWREYSKQAFYTSTILSDSIVDGIEAIYINGIEVLLDANGYVTTPPFNTVGGKLIQIELRYGYIDQSKSGLLFYGLPNIITDQHIGSGIAYLTARIVKDTDEQWNVVFKGQLPQIMVALRGALIYDPRDVTQIAAIENSHKYSTNPCLNVLHYISAKKLYGLSRSFFQDQTLTATANYCDELIGTKTRGLRKRFECGGIVSYDEAPKDVVQKMLDSFNGKIFITNDGLFGLTCDGLDQPVITLTEKHVLSISAKRTPGAFFEYSSVKARYSSEDHRYVPLCQEAAPWVDAATVALIGRDIPAQKDYPFVFRHDQVQHLAKAEFYKLNPEWTLDIEFNAAAVQLLNERLFTFDFNITEDDGTQTSFIKGVFRIVSITPSATDYFNQISVHCISVADAAGQWNGVMEEGTAPALAPNTSNSIVPQTPTNLNVFVGDVDSTAAFSIRAVASWQANSDGHQQEAQFKLSSDTVWINAPVNSYDRAYPMPISGVLTPGASYDFRVRLTNSTYGVSNWATISFLANAVAGPTGPLQNFAAGTDALRIVTSISQASSATAGFTETVVLAHGAALNWAGSIYKAATQNQTINNFIAIAAGNYDLYARSVGLNADVGPVSGPINLVVAAVPVSTGTGGTTGVGGGNNSGNGSRGPNDGGAGLSPANGGIYGANTNSSNGPTNDGGSGTTTNGGIY